MRLLYRIQQTWGVILDRPSPQDLHLVQSILTPAQMKLFLHMQPSEQAHSIKIYKRLCRQGETQQDLQVAALLHDTGKSRYPISILERIVVVLGQTFLPQKAHSWGNGSPSGWRKSFVIAQNHAMWGAEMAAQAGASDLTVEIIRRHHDPIIMSEVPDPSGELASRRAILLKDRLIYCLQQTDNEN